MTLTEEAKGMTFDVFSKTREYKKKTGTHASCVHKGGLRCGACFSGCKKHHDFCLPYSYCDDFESRNSNKNF